MPNVASISDVHLGHPETPTELIVRNLDRAFPDNETTGRLDAIFIVGDLFDRSLNMHDRSALLIQLWMDRFLRMCVKRDIELWVLEGTPSHDWRQSLFLDHINRLARIGAAVHYVDTLSIHHSPKLGHLLFVPDEWAPETDDTWRQVCQLLQQHGLSQVDFTLLHGCWDFQLPEHVKTPKHVLERYESITRHYIFSGHVHGPAQRGKLCNNGSFDRLTHGEEEAKGHWRVEVGGVAGDRITFVENTGAKVYRTIDCRELPVEQALVKIDAEVAGLPEGSAARVLAVKGKDAILTSLDLLRKRHPHITWKSKAADDKDVETQSNLLVDLRSTYTQIPITKANLRELVLERVRSLTNDPRVLSRCDQRLMEFAQ